MRYVKLLALALCLALLTGCAGTESPLRATATLAPGTSPRLPEAEAPADQVSQEEALLYFRFQNEPYLAAESRVITHAPSEPYELALLTALLSGPMPQSAELNALFPPGTQVLSTSRLGRTLFVTLSREIMNPYPDEAAGSQSTAEAQLRRRLCMQSLVATVTESCDVDSVQVLVEATGDTTDSLRLQQSYFLVAGEEHLVSPMTRDESLLLTPGRAMQVILSLWSQQDWQRLYLYIASDPLTGQEKRSYADFVTAMENLPRLVEAIFAGGSVSADGRWAAYTLEATILADDHQQETRAGKTLRLLRENGLWKVTLSQLTDWLEVGQ